MATSAGEALLPMFQDVIEMLALARAGFNRRDTAGLETAAALGRSIHKREKELTQELLAAPPEPEALRFVPAHLERMGDAIEGVIRCVRTIDAEGTVFTDRGIREVNELFVRRIVVRVSNVLPLPGPYSFALGYAVLRRIGVDVFVVPILTPARCWVAKQRLQVLALNPLWNPSPLFQDIFPFPFERTCRSSK